jgi:inorganic pyrophosphatase
MSDGSAYAKLQAYDRVRKRWRVVVETPQGSRHKFKYEPKLGVFTRHSVLPKGMTFPYDFGFLPGTEAEDGDPIDVLLLMDAPVFSGCVVPARLIGVIEARQTSEWKTVRNDRLLAVPAEEDELVEVRSAGDLDKKTLKEIEAFFATYNMLRGKRFKILGIRGPRHAEKLARKAMHAAGAGKS